jgi:D-alanyl-D-alanine dipeptidase
MLLVLLACAGDADVATPTVPPAPAPPAAAPATPAPPTPAQALVVVGEDWASKQGSLQRWARLGAAWEPVGAPVPVVFGAGGLGWGVGQHAASLATVDEPQKREGDGRAPAGIFALGPTFGYAEAAPWAMPYVPSTAASCVDDPASTHYNTIVDGAVSVDWKSAEQMRRNDALYTWGAVVSHNMSPPTPGLGSCIFLHVWRAPGKPTVGCTAMDERALVEVLSWLDPADEPVLVQGPRSVMVRLLSVVRIGAQP